MSSNRVEEREKCAQFLRNIDCFRTFDFLLAMECQYNVSAQLLSTVIDAIPMAIRVQIYFTSSCHRCCLVCVISVSCFVLLCFFCCVSVICVALIDPCEAVCHSTSRVDFVRFLAGQLVAARTHNSRKISLNTAGAHNTSMPLQTVD